MAVVEAAPAATRWREDEKVELSLCNPGFKFSFTVGVEQVVGCAAHVDVQLFEAHAGLQAQSAKLLGDRGTSGLAREETRNPDCRRTITRRDSDDTPFCVHKCGDALVGVRSPRRILRRDVDGYAFLITKGVKTHRHGSALRLGCRAKRRRGVKIGADLPVREIAVAVGSPGGRGGKRGTIDGAGPVFKTVRAPPASPDKESGETNGEGTVFKTVVAPPASTDVDSASEATSLNGVGNRTPAGDPDEIWTSFQPIFF